jgi:hypothetical protein
MVLFPSKIDKTKLIFSLWTQNLELLNILNVFSLSLSLDDSNSHLCIAGGFPLESPQYVSWLLEISELIMINFEVN